MTDTVTTRIGAVTGVRWGANSSGYEGKNHGVGSVQLGPIAIPATPPSGTPVANQNKFPVIVSLYGAAVTQIAVNNDQKTTGPGEVIVNPGETVAWGGTGLPTMKWRRLQN